MPATKSQTPQGIEITTDEWTIVWTNQQLDLRSKQGLKHTALCGDPHICTDGEPVMDFPTPTCSFVLTDGTFIVADAPAANQPLNDVHVFTDDGQHVSLGASAPFDDVIGMVFVQQDDGSFYAVTSRDIGTTTRILCTSSTGTSKQTWGCRRPSAPPLSRCRAARSERWKAAGAQAMALQKCDRPQRWCVTAPLATSRYWPRPVPLSWDWRPSSRRDRRRSARSEVGMFGRVGSSCMWMPRLKRCSWIASDACAQMSRSFSSCGIGPICATSQRRLDSLLQLDAGVGEV